MAPPEAPDLPSGPITCCFQALTKEVTSRNGLTWSISLMVAWISSFVSVVLFVVAFCTGQWAVAESQGSTEIIHYIGLWTECNTQTGCGPVDYTNHLSQRYKVGIAAFYIRLVTVLFLVVTMAVFASTWSKPKYAKSKYIKSLGYSYILMVMSFILEAFGTLFMYVEMATSKQRSKAEEHQSNLVPYEYNEHFDDGWLEAGESDTKPFAQETQLTGSANPTDSLVMGHIQTSPKGSRDLHEKLTALNKNRHIYDNPGYADSGIGSSEVDPRSVDVQLREPRGQSCTSLTEDKLKRMSLTLSEPEYQSSSLVPQTYDDREKPEHTRGHDNRRLTQNIQPHSKEKQSAPNKKQHMVHVHKETCPNTAEMHVDTGRGALGDNRAHPPGANAVRSEIVKATRQPNEPLSARPKSQPQNRHKGVNNPTEYPQNSNGLREYSSKTNNPSQYPVGTSPRDPCPRELSREHEPAKRRDPVNDNAYRERPTRTRKEPEDVAKIHRPSREQPPYKSQPTSDPFSSVSHQQQTTYNAAHDAVSPTRAIRRRRDKSAPPSVHAARAEPPPQLSKAGSMHSLNSAVSTATTIVAGKHETEI